MILIIICIILIILSLLYIYNNNENFNNNNENFNNIILPYDIVVVGCARNIEQYLKTTKKKLKMINKLFKSCRIIIYDNDSTDNTLNILKEWENEKLIELISEKNVPGLRTERLAHGRNILYNEAMKQEFELYMVIDLDNVIDKLSYKSIINCFKEPMNDIDWAMVSGNQSGRYYDIWALRTYDDWMPFDCWICYNNEKKSKKYCVTSRYKKISYNSDPIKVKSSFGGCAIYNRKYLDNCSYGNGLQLFNNNNIEICEHVAFNECIIKNGGSIYINPKFINS